MQELKRKPRIVEQLKVGDEVLEIVISPEEIAKDYVKANVAVGQAKLALAKAKAAGERTEALMEQIGNAVVQFMSVMLGAANTEKIVKFYENNYIEMINEVSPFIVSTIVPQIEKALKDMRDRKRESYKQLRKGKGVFRR